MKYFLLPLLCLFFLTGTVHARSTIPVVNLENESIMAASGKVLSLDDIARALRLAAPKRGWRIEETGPGKAIGTLEVRGKHTIKVDIGYTERAISFTYKDSVNMKYGKDGDGNPVIHPFYIKWVQNLLSDVRAEVSRF
ncbi:MAG: hypothetical protein Q8O33_11050 [Pseudomonadota bacterium]|nr:hypothetical protein [Pseudomonadota bacterium]